MGGSLDLSGTPITALPDGLTVGGYLYLSGDQWAKISFADLQKFAAPWFLDSLSVEDIGRVTGWCEDGIREAMDAIGLGAGGDAEEYPAPMFTPPYVVPRM